MNAHVWTPAHRREQKALPGPCRSLNHQTKRIAARELFDYKVVRPSLVRNTGASFPSSHHGHPLFQELLHILEREALGDAAPGSLRRVRSALVGHVTLATFALDRAYDDAGHVHTQVAVGDEFIRLDL